MKKGCPWQVLLGSMETLFCVFVSLALWLEIMLETAPYTNNTLYIFTFNNDISVPGGGKKASKFVQDYLSKKVFNRPFYKGGGSKLGMHSHRKFASSESRKEGCSKDKKDIQGRWRGKGHVLDIYDDIEFPRLLGTYLLSDFLLRSIHLSQLFSSIKRTNASSDTVKIEEILIALLSFVVHFLI